jgi:phosphohistidine phosphatase SixA
VWPAHGLSGDGPATVVYLVRHAEKTGADEDPGLSAAGRQRAGELAQLLGDRGIHAVYSTDFRRTRDTAAPLAERLGLPVTLYDWEKMRELAAEMTRRGGRYLVVGHSDTTPEMVSILGGDPGPPIEDRDEYDRLYVVEIAADGGVSTDLRRFGRPYEP